MQKKIVVMFILAVLTGIGLILTSCHKMDKITPSPLDTTIPTTPPSPGAVQGGAPAPAAPPASAVFGTNYSGRADYSTVTSNSRCRSDSDCTFSKYSNAPRSARECTCQAACEPFVVNTSEAAARKESNERLCGPSSWFGPKCTVPPCNFIEYDQFKCEKGLCVGIDLNGM